MAHGFRFKFVDSSADASNTWIRVELEVNCEINSVASVIDEFMMLIRKCQSVAGQELDVEVALREALTCVVSRRNRLENPGTILVACRCVVDGEVAITIIDESAHKIPMACENAAVETNTLANNHSRIHLIRALMDETYFERGGREFHMRKLARGGDSETFRRNGSRSG